MRTIAMLLCAMVIIRSSFAAPPAAEYVVPGARPLDVAPVPVASKMPGPEIEKKRKVLESKLAERDSLQHEIKALQQETGVAEQFVVNVKLIEVNHTKLKNVGFDFAFLDGANVASSAAGILKDDGQVGFTQVAASDSFIGFLRALERDGAVSFLADPKLVTVDGRPASFHVGEIITLPSSIAETPGQTEKFGTEVEVLVESAGNNQAQVKLKLRQSTGGLTGQIQSPVWIPINASQIVCWAMSEFTAKASPPTALRSHVTEINTGVEVTLGEPVLLGGLRTVKNEGASFLNFGSKSQSEEFEMLVFISVNSSTGLQPHRQIRQQVQPAAYPPPVAP